jgi:phosphoglycolate phosphatase
MDHTRLYDGVAEMLDRLAAVGLPMCVLSNKPQAYTLMTVEGLMSGWRFVQVLGESDHFPRKPDPAGALRLVERMGLRPEEVAMVGDSEVDVETAGNAGLCMIGVTWGFRDRVDLERAGAARIIDKPEQLPGLLGVGA